MMNNKELKILRSFLNDFIKSEKVNKYLISIPWVHFIRFHPEINKKYSDLFIQNCFINRIKIFLKYNFKIFLTLFYQLYKLLLIKKTYFWYGSKRSSKVDVLFISHLINNEPFTNEEDIYFGKIPSKLQERKIKVAVAYINYIKSPFSTYKKTFNEVSYQKYFFTDSLGFKFEYKIFKSLLNEFYRIKSFRKFYKKKSFENKVVKHMSKQLLMNGTITNLRLYEQIQLLVKKIKPKNIIVTYEGHAWERIAFLAARTQLPAIKCISYQHTGVFEHSNSIKIKLQDLYNPDLICTSGSFTRNELRKQKDLIDIEVVEVGSPRGLISKNNLISSNDNTNSCLVIPEGFISECNYLFEFSLKCAFLNPKINFIWRLHPSLSFDKILKTNKKYNDLPTNIILSNNSLDQDIIKCKWVLYRGSSAVFKAISFGLYPLYLRLINEISIDPLYEMSKFKLIVDDPIKFNHSILNIDVKLNSKTLNNRNNLYKDFCSKQFSKINMKLIEEKLIID